MQVKKYDSKAAVVGTPKAYSTGEDMVAVKTVSERPPAVYVVLSAVGVVCVVGLCVSASTSKMFLTGRC